MCVADMERITVTVDRERLDEWDDWISSTHGIDSRSALVRRAVELFISEPESESGGLDEEVVVELLESMDELRQLVGALNDDLSMARSEQLGADEVSEIVEHNIIFTLEQLIDSGELS